MVKLNLSRCKPESRQLLSAMLAAFNSRKGDQLYVCRTCQSYIRRNQVPSQAAINSLKLDDTPKQLHLTELECALIAQRVPFMKVLALPRGQQRVIRGAVVNVPSNVLSTTTVLPLTPAQAGIIPIKLKRRLRYKGYVMHQFVRPDAILSAVRWLVQNNQLYCRLDIDEDWHKSCMEEDPEAWNSMTGGVTQPAEHLSDVVPSSESDDTEPVAQDSDVEPSDSGNDSDRDVVMEKVRGLSFSTCLQPTDPQYTATALCVAPAEGQHPLDFMLDYSCEALTFPAKFPFGVGTFTDERDVPITVKKYFIQRLLNRDKRFASDASYLFFAQYICEMEQIRDNITVAMRKTAGRM